MTKVLIGFGEAMAAIETTWSLQEAGYTVAAFCRAGNRPALGHIPGVVVHEVPPPERDAMATVTAVARLLRTLRPAAVLPLDDHAVWVCRRLEDSDVALAGPIGAAADFALDKGLQMGAADQTGLSVPDTRVVNDLSEVEPVDSPVMIKPAHALYEIGGKLVRPTGVVSANTEEFGRAARRRWHPPLLIQPLIQGVGEGLFGFAGASGVIGWSAHRRVRMVNPQGSASSACRSFPVDDGLVEPGEQFLRAIGWRGMFMLEFLRDADGTPWFMELNGRAWGSMALARRRGFEYPAWTVRARLDGSYEPSPPSRPPDVLCRNLGLELVHLMFVARGPQSDAEVVWPRLGQAVRDVCRIGRGDRFYNWKPSQPRVLVVDTVQTLSGYTRKIGRARRRRSASVSHP